MFVVENLSFNYDKKKILTGFSCHFEAGRSYGLSGPSGIGKSTFCKLLSGQLVPSHGTVHLDGKNVTGKMSRKVLMVSQDVDLFAWQTVSKTIDFFKEPETSKDELLSLVALDKYRDFYPKQLSGGMKKRLSLCRALSANPSVLIIDELFSSQDAALQEELFKSLSRYVKEKRKVLIVVSHDVESLKKHCDQHLNFRGDS
jgi:ABC-type multidrug transport system ATPase subunit